MQTDLDTAPLAATSSAVMLLSQAAGALTTSGFSGPLSTVNEMPGRYFPLTYFAFSSNGTLYADDIPGDTGDESHQEPVSVQSSRISRLWQEKNTTAK